MLEAMRSFWLKRKEMEKLGEIRSETTKQIKTEYIAIIPELGKAKTGGTNEA